MKPMHRHTCGEKPAFDAAGMNGYGRLYTDTRKTYFKLRRPPPCHGDENYSLFADNFIVCLCCEHIYQSVDKAEYAYCDNCADGEQQGVCKAENQKQLCYILKAKAICTTAMVRGRKNTTRI